MYSLRDGGEITETIKNAFKYNITKAYLEVVNEDTDNLIIHHNNYLKDINFDDCRYEESEGIIGTTIAKELNGSFVNVDSAFNIENKEVKLYIGACLDNSLNNDEGKTDNQIINDPNVVWLKYGTFIVQKPENDNVKDNTKFDALDYMIKFNKPFEDRLDYDDPEHPVTLGRLLEDICGQVGVVCGTTVFRNSTYELTENYFVEGETCRDVLKAIAQMAFSWARINEDDELVLDFNLSNTITEEIDYDEYYDLTFNNEYGPINTIILRNSQVEGENYTIHSDDYIEGTTKPIELVIADNPFAYTQSTREILIQAGRQIMGLEYIPITLKTIGAIYLNCLDKMRIKNMQNEYYTTYIFNNKISYTGKTSDEKETTALTETETKYQYTGNISPAVRRTEVIVNKMEGTIKLLSETTDTITEEIIPGMQSDIDAITDTTGTASGKFIHLEDCSDQPFNSIVMNGETSQVTSSQNSNLFDEKYYNNDSLYTSGTYKYTKARFKGNRTLYFKASLKEGKTAQEGAYIAISESAGSPYGSGKKTLYAIRNGAVQTTTSFDFTGVTDLYVNIYPNDLTCSTIFNNYNLWVSTNDVDYAPFVPDMPSSDYSSEIKNADGRNKFSGWVKGVGLSSTTGEETNWSTYATSGYIPVNFNSSPNYYLSGVADTLHHWVGAYNAQKQFLGRTGGANSKTRGLNANSFTSGTPQGTGDIAYLRATQYVGSGDTATIDVVDNLQTQLEEGTVASQYVPYDSLEIKVNNKNILEIDINNISLVSNNLSGLYTIENGVITLNGTPSETGSIYFKRFKVNSGKYTLSTNIQNYTVLPSGNSSIFLQQSTDNVNWSTFVEIGNQSNTQVRTFNMDDEHYYRIRVYLSSACTFNNTTYSLQLEKSEEKSGFEANIHQTAYFPLQGEKLMQGDYIDSQGIHHKRARITLNGTETWSNQSGAYDTTTRIMFSHADSRIKNNLANRKGVCDYFVNYSTTVQSPNVDVTAFNFHQSAQYSNYLYFKIEKNKLPTADVAGWKAWLAEHPITVEYELAEYDLTPFTTDQQKAWDEISLLTTYKRITNISSDASLDIEYLKDNGLDVYETRSSAEVTKSQVSRLTIEEERIASEVSSTKSSLTNYYTKDESDASMQSTKDELNNIISQNKTEAEQTAEQIALRISSIETNGSTRVETTTGYTFDDEGLKIDKTGAVTSSVIDNEAFKVNEKSTGENVIFAGYVSDQSSEYRGQTIVRTKNLVVKNYLNIEGASRFQPYTNPVLGGHGTGAFDIG